jgi:hypothetical protein
MQPPAGPKRLRGLGELHGVAHVVPGGALLASEPLGIPHLPKRNDLADVIEDDGAVAQQVWQLELARPPLRRLRRPSGSTAHDRAWASTLAGVYTV